MMNMRMNSSVFLLVSFVGTALSVGSPEHAQDTPEVSEIDKIFGWATQSTPGCAVAVSLHGKVIVNRAYGLADVEREIPISPDTVFDAASVTKQFVAAATLILVEEGRLSLTEDIHTYVPELPEYGQKITLDHLMTHTSGIRDWTGILPMSAGDPDALTVVLRQRGLNFAPGEEMSYSNSGYVLLKEIVARRSGMSFGEFAGNRLFEPLGMKSTQYQHNLREVVKNRALAYEKDGDHWTVTMKLDNDRGGGGALLSTPGDLLIWNETLTNGTLGAFVTQKLQEPATLNNGRTVPYARGLFLDSYRGVKEIWHSGGAAGYSTWLGRYPDQGLSIAVMANAGDSAPSAMYAHRIFELFVPNAVESDPEDGPPPALPEDVLLNATSKAGLFFNEQTGEPMRLAVDRGRLRVAGGPGLLLVANSGGNRFRRWGDSLQYMSGDKFEILFLSQDQFEMKSMEGKTTRYRRAQPHAPTPDELKGFAGRYDSDEMGSVFLIEAKDDSLVVRLEHLPEKPREIKSVERDTFQVGGVTVRFIRNETGKVVALNYSNPVVSNIKFTRLGDRESP